MTSPADDPVVAALQAALAARPEPSLHLALAERWLTLSQPEQSLPHLTAILDTDPAHIAALGLAARAARAAGLADKAAAWQRLHDALSGSAPRTERAPLEGPSPTPTQASGPENVVRLVQPDAAPQEAPDPSRATFADVGGLESVKRRLELSFLAPLRQPEVYRAYGRSIKGGLLLYGPPGCGKTHIARATAGEVGARFTSVGLVDVLDMWIGESEKRLHELFESARRQAPVVLFLDELDALGQKRSQLRHRAGRSLVNQLLVELDGLD